MRQRRGQLGGAASGRSVDPAASEVLVGFPPYRRQSSSELSSPSNETCYSFVRKAIQVSICPNHCFLLTTSNLFA